jgi:hypothetical protein
LGNPVIDEDITNMKAKRPVDLLEFQSRLKLEKAQSKPELVPFALPHQHEDVVELGSGAAHTMHMHSKWHH